MQRERVAPRGLCWSPGAGQLLQRTGPSRVPMRMRMGEPCPAAQLLLSRIAAGRSEQSFCHAVQRGAQLRSPLPTAAHGCARPFLQRHGATWVLLARWGRKQIAARILQPGGCPGSAKGPWVCAGGGDPNSWSCPVPCLCSIPALLEAGDAFQLLCHAQMLSGEAAPEVVPRIGPLWVQGLCSGAAPPSPAMHHPKISGSACRSPARCAQAGNGGSA